MSNLNTDIILDPIAILETSAYYIKNSHQKATFGLLYGQQVQLNYRISLTAPLGTSAQSAQQLIQRYKQYEQLRIKRSKSTVNFYEEYTLLGMFVVQSVIKNFNLEDKKVLALSEQLWKADAPYTLFLDAEVHKDPVLLKKNQPHKYRIQIQKNERLCLDSLYTSNSNQLAVLNHSIAKKKTSIQVFTDKITLLLEKLNKSKNPSPQTLMKIDEILTDYNRLCAMSEKNKDKVIDAMNYSIVTGIAINRIVNS